MATFEAKVVRLTIEDHPNADVLELARVGDYLSIVPIGKFKTGDLGVYIPEQAVLPEWLITELGLGGKLAGNAKNRVKAIKLRKILSQGLIYPVWVDGFAGNNYVSGEEVCDRQFVNEGDDVTEFLGITKYEPPIPTHMSGEVSNLFGYTVGYDVENIKRFPDVFNAGEEVAITEKLHGTWCCFGFHPEVGVVVTSKGLSGKGLAFKFNEANERNLYVKAYENTRDSEGLSVMDRWLLANYFDTDKVEPIYILGEIFGQGVQDLTYGLTKPQFRGFDVYIGTPGSGRYLNFEDKFELFTYLGIDMVPVLYVGPFCQAVVDDFTNGKETISGSEANIREGIVIIPTLERREDELGRVMLKSVSDAYLLRKGGTELN